MGGFRDGQESYWSASSWLLPEEEGGESNWYSRRVRCGTFGCPVWAVCLVLVFLTLVFGWRGIVFGVAALLLIRCANSAFLPSPSSSGASSGGDLETGKTRGSVSFAESLGTPDNRPNKVHPSHPS